jgi:hypothetical protein
MPSTYLARTTLHVSSPPALPPDKHRRIDFSTYQRTQAALVTSRLVLSAALLDPRVVDLSIVRRKANPVAWLEKAIKADYTIAPEILSISLSGEDAEELVILVNAVRDAYLQEIVNREQNEMQSRLERLRQFLQSRDDLLRQKRNTRKKLAQALVAQDPETLARAQLYILERLESIRRELMRTRTELRRAQAEALAQPAKQKPLDQQESPEGDIEEQLRKDVVIARLQLEIPKLERDYQLASFLAPDNHPAATQAKAALAAARKEVAERRAKIRPLIVGQLRERARHAAQASAAHRKEQIAFLRQLESALQKEFEALEVQTKKLRQGAIKIEDLNDEVTREEESVKKITDQVRTLSFELQAPARVTLLESAASTPKADRRALLAGGAGFAAFACVLLGIGCWGFRARRVNRAGAQ